MGFLRSYFEQKNEKWARRSLEMNLKELHLFTLDYKKIANKDECKKVLHDVLFFRKFDTIKKENDEALYRILDILRSKGIDGSMIGSSKATLILRIAIIDGIEGLKDDRIDNALLHTFKFDEIAVVRERAKAALDQRGWKPVSLNDEIYFNLLGDKHNPDKFIPLTPPVIECLFKILEERNHQPDIYLRVAELLSDNNVERAADRIFYSAVNNNLAFLHPILKKLKWLPLFSLWCFNCKEPRLGEIKGMGVGLEGGRIRCPSCGEDFSYTITEDQRYVYLLRLSRVSTPAGHAGKTEMSFGPFPFNSLI